MNRWGYPLCLFLLFEDLLHEDLLLERSFTMLNKLLSNHTSLAVVGLGYVGLPIAIAFSKKVSVIGYDNNKDKIEQYKAGRDPTNEIGDQALKDASLLFTNDEKLLQQAHFIIISVPTPIHGDKTPDLSPVTKASITVGRNLKKGAIVVYESTVYPGVTEDICRPILEKESGYICGQDFYIGYSPERINPGDKVHTLTNIVKIVSGMDFDTLQIIANIYELVIQAGVHRAKSIKVAEAAKLVENAQRDINIAFMNELSMVFEKMNISTVDVIKAMNTKWNALGFYPGLVGGHCIGVDPYYFIYEAEKLGCHSQLIAAGRKINNDMPFYISEMIIKQLILANIHVNGANVCIMGATFKENCPDIRNSKAKEIIKKLEEYHIHVQLVDPWADKQEVFQYFHKDLTPILEITKADCLVFTTAHQEFIDLKMNDVKTMFRSDSTGHHLIIDIRNIFNWEEVEKNHLKYWNL